MSLAYEAYCDIYGIDKEAARVRKGFIPAAVVATSILAPGTHKVMNNPGELGTKYLAQQDLKEMESKYPTKQDRKNLLSQVQSEYEGTWKKPFPIQENREEPSNPSAEVARIIGTPTAKKVLSDTSATTAGYVRDETRRELKSAIDKYDRQAKRWNTAAKVMDAVTFKKPGKKK